MWPKKIALTSLVAAASVMNAWGQLPIPVSGANPAPSSPSSAQPGAPGAGRGGRGGGRGAQAAAEPVKQLAAPIPAAIEVTRPGEFYETFMDNHDDVKSIDIPAKDAYAKFN